MNYDQMAKEILNLVGGKENVTGLTHCATRLRFNLADSQAADMDGVKEIDGVLGAVNSGGQFQIIIGNQVPKVYASVEKLVHAGGEKTVQTEAAPKEKKKFLDRIFEFISAVFTPILPAIIGAGLIKSFLALAVLLGMDSEGTVYYFINLIGDAPLYFLPVMLAYTGAKKLGCNQYIAVGIAGAMLHPNYTALVTDAYSLHFTSFLGIPVTLASYSYGVIPSLLMVIALFYTEKLLDRIIPKMLQFFFKPVISLVFVGMLSFIVLGPIGFIIGTGISTGLDALNQVAGWAVPTIVGCIFPLMVTTGMHYGFVPFMIQSLGAQGFETLCGPGNLPSNIAQGAASLATAFKTKNIKMKETAFTTGTTALLGITEPALYSVTLKSKKTLASVMIGGGLGGFYAGITGVKCFSFCSPGLLSLVAFIGSDGWSNLINACISMAISFVVTFAVTWFWGFEEADEIKKAGDGVLTKTGEAEPVVQAAE